MQHQESSAVDPGQVEVPHGEATDYPNTPEALVAHYQEYPEAYHEALRPHVERFIGQHIVSTDSELVQNDTQPETAADEPMTVEKYVAWGLYFDNQDATTQPDPIDAELYMSCRKFERAHRDEVIELSKARANTYFPELTVGRLILTRSELSSEDQQLVINFMYDFDEGIETVAYDIQKFPDISFDNEMTTFLVENSHDPWTLIDRSEKFEGIDEYRCELAEALIRYQDWKSEPFLINLRAMTAEQCTKTYELLVADVRSAPESDIVSDCKWDWVVDHLEDFEGFDERILLDEARNYDKDATGILKNLYKFKELQPDDLEWLSKEARYRVRAFPHEGNEKAKNRWFAEHAYVYLDGGFSKDMIGKVIRLRIENGLEPNLHDASQWLYPFRIPEAAYDINYIKQHCNDEDFDFDMIGQRQLKDVGLEQSLITSLLQAPKELRAQLQLHDRPDRIAQLFSDVDLQMMYNAIVALDENGVPHYKHPDFDIEWLAATWTTMDLDHIDDYYQLGHDQKAVTTERSLSLAPSERESLDVAAILDEFVEETTVQDLSIGRQIERLKELGIKRKAYIDDASTWLVRHALAPHQTLTQAWGDRALALGMPADQNGDRPKDSASSIIAWQKREGLNMALRTEEVQNQLADVGLTADYIKAPRLAPWRQELTRVLGVDQTLDAIMRHHAWTSERTWTEKLIDKSSAELTVADKQWRFDVLGADDPRGFTIGEDTGCCMTIYGVSESCIQAGYQLSNAGFIALYGDDGRLSAQSFWFVNPDKPDVLVLDNIEANAGRDFGKITQVYAEALKTIVTNHNAQKPDSPINTVHLGEGYTQVNIGHLKKVTPVPALEQVYSDATRQRLLLQVAA